MVTCGLVKISSGKSWLFLGMAEKLLEGDMEVSVVMTASLFPVPLPKTVHKKCTVEATSSQKDKTKCQISVGWYRSHTLPTGWKPINERHRGFERMTMAPFHLFCRSTPKVNIFFLSGLSNSLSRCLTWQLSQMHCKHRRKGQDFSGKYLLHHSRKKCLSWKPFAFVNSLDSRVQPG